MKRLFLICIGLLLTAVDCTKDTENRHYHILFSNKSNKTLYVFYDMYSYPDTLVSDYYCPFDTVYDKIGPNESSKLWSRAFFETVQNDCGIVMIFIYEYDTYTTYGWPILRDSNMVTQRYDLSVENLREINWQLSFPPTEEMRSIKMWPPYGSYDANGNRIK